MPSLLITSYKRNDDGTAAVEFGIIVLLFLTVVFGIVDTGRAFMAMNAFQNGLESATRYAIVNPEASEQEIEDFVVADMAGFTLADEDINVTVEYPVVSDIDFVEISGTYQFTPLVTSFLPDSWSALTLPASARMPVPAP